MDATYFKTETAPFLDVKCIQIRHLIVKFEKNNLSNGRRCIYR